MRLLSLFLLVFGLALCCVSPLHAQQNSRLGVGLQILGSTKDNNVGPGVRFRASTPVNQDLSLAVGSGFTGYIFRGRDDAAFALDPQASAILTFSAQGPESTYALAGAGAYVPFGETSGDSGPTFHLGGGKVWLLNESTFFFEFNPAFLIGKETTTLVLPVRAGVIL